MILVLRRQQRERDDREGEVHELVPDACDRDRQRRRPPAANFHERSIEYEAAIPTAAPAGETIESAVDAWVIAMASRNPSPGSAAIHGGGNVARFRTTAPASTASPASRAPRTTSSTSR